MSKTPLPLYVPTPQVAALLGVTPRTLARWRATGDGPKCIQIRTRWYYPRNEIQRWLHINSMTTANSQGAREKS